MDRSSLRKITIAALTAAALLALGVPLGLYGLGLANIEGRPEVPTRTNDIEADAALLHQTFRSQAPVAVRSLNPWTYAETLLTATGKDLQLDIGSRAVWTIVSNYNRNHLKYRKMIWWHLSGTSLMIWVSRHWTTEEIVTEAAAIVRSTFPSYSSASLIEVRSFGRLPKELGALLGAHWKCCGMVDVGDEFHPTDVAGGPDKRFVLAGVSKESALVAYEWGNGWERGIDAAAYVFAGSDWHLVARWRLDAIPSSLSQLTSETEKLPSGIVQSHYFDREPDFTKEPWKEP